MSSTTHGLVATDLRKSYPGGRGSARIQALGGLSIDVEPGTIFGLLGPNDTGRENLVLAGRLQGMRGGDARARAT